MCRKIFKMEIKNNNKKLFLLDGFSFLFGFQLILSAYIMSSYLQKASGIKTASVFFFFAYVLSFLIIINLHNVVKRFGKSNTLFLSLIINALALCGAAFFSNGFGAFSASLALMMTPIVFVSLDLLVETHSRDKITGAIRGKFLTIMNLGCFLAPFLGAWLVFKSGGYFWSFFISAIFLLVILILAKINFPHVNHNIQKNYSICQVIKKIWERKNIRKIYYISLILEVFYSIMIVYTPLFLLDQGLDWETIGKIFTVMLIPFILLQYPMGVLADKKSGEKEWLVFAILLMSAAVFVISIFYSNNVVFWMAVLFISRIGAALIEILRDSYFYKQVDGQDVDIINFYRTGGALAYLIAMPIAIGLRYFLPFNFLYIFLGIFILTGLIPLLTLKDSR